MIPIMRGLTTGAQLQEAVHGGGLHPGQLGEALGGPARGGCKDDLVPLGQGQGDDRCDGEGLAAAGATGEHAHLLAQREPYRPFLCFGELGTGTFPQPFQGHVPIDVCKCRHAIGRFGQQCVQPAGQAPLRAVERQEVERAYGVTLRAGDDLRRNTLLGQECGDALHDQ